MGKIKIKPVFVSYEKGFFRELPSAEEFEKRVNEVYSKLKKLYPEVDFSEPALITDVAGLNRLKSELTYDTDGILVYRLGGIAHKLLADIGLIGPPLIMVGRGVLNHDIVAYLRQRGREAYAVVDEKDLSRLFFFLTARKRVKSTRVLVVSSKSLPSFSAISSAYDLDLMKVKLGIDYEWISSEKLLSEMEKVSDKEAREVLDDILSYAIKVEVSEENLLKAVKLYIALKKLLKENYCNAVAVDCAEPIYFEHRVTPCLAFTLLKDEGIPASCEADLSALTAMIILMYLSNKPAFMGNLWLHSAEENIVRYSHDVPPTRILGEDRKPFELHDFHDKNYGATVYVEVPKELKITLARVDSSFSKILVFKGTVKASHEGVGCRETLDIKVNNALDLVEKVANYGHHFAAVLGDYTEELIKLAKMMKIEPECA